MVRVRLDRWHRDSERRLRVRADLINTRNPRQSSLPGLETEPARSFTAQTLHLLRLVGAGANLIVAWRNSNSDLVFEKGRLVKDLFLGTTKPVGYLCELLLYSCSRV